MISKQVSIYTLDPGLLRLVVTGTAGETSYLRRGLDFSSGTLEYLLDVLTLDLLQTSKLPSRRYFVALPI